MMLIKLSFIATLKIKQLFYVICLLFMIFLVLVVVPITLAKEKEHWIITDNNSAVYKHLNDCTGVQHLFNIASQHLSLFTSSSPIQNSDKFDLRTARINLVQDNNEITDKHKNLNILLFKEALKIKN